jgi:hypothetical protein
MTPIQTVIHDLPPEFHALMPKLLALLAEERFIIIDSFDKGVLDVITGENIFNNGQEYYDAKFGNRDIQGNRKGI